MRKKNVPAGSTLRKPRAKRSPSHKISLTISLHPDSALIGTKGCGTTTPKNAIVQPQKEIPMLFSSPMVKALVNRLKFETRRLRGLDEVNKNPGKWKFIGNLGHPYWGHYFRFKGPAKNSQGLLDIRCPYGAVGDLIWVREAVWEHGKYVRVDVGETGEIDTEWRTYGHPQYSYCATDVKPKDCRTRPNIHMPKAAARIWLKITDIKAQRLQEITQENAKNEGIEPLLMSSAQLAHHGQLYRDYGKKPALFNSGLSPKESFKTLWIKINGRRSWNKNPWVWVVKFEFVEKK